MNWKDLINEGSIALALVVTIAALAVVVIVSGADAIGATGLRDLAILLGGALAGTKIPKSGA
jgi:ABC-type methionine transport system permease subunit